MNSPIKSKLFFLIFVCTSLFLTSCSKWWLGVWGVSAIAYIFIGGDYAYSVKYGKEINLNENDHNYEQQIHCDSAVVKVLKIVDETANEFSLEQRTGFYDTELREGYYSFRYYQLPKIARKDYEYHFLEFSASFFLRDSMFVVQIADFPSRRQSKLSKQIENAIVTKFETRLEKAEIHRVSKR